MKDIEEALKIKNNNIYNDLLNNRKLIENIIKNNNSSIKKIIKDYENKSIWIGCDFK